MKIMPFGDDQAHGQIAGAVIVQRWRGLVFCKEYTKPNNPKTQEQKRQRGKFSNAVNAWNHLTPVEVEYWKIQAIGKSYTGYNLFISDYILNPPYSSTPFLFNIMNSGVINSPRSSFSNGWRFTFFSDTLSKSLISVDDNSNTVTKINKYKPIYFSGIQILKVSEDLNIQYADTITVQYDLFKYLDIFLPAINGISKVLYIANDGSTFYDSSYNIIACPKGG